MNNRTIRTLSRVGMTLAGGISPTVREDSEVRIDEALPDGRASAPHRASTRSNKITLYPGLAMLIITGLKAYYAGAFCDLS